MKSLSIILRGKIILITIFIFNTSILFCQENFGTVKDIDGNVYKTVKIGNQWWMAENLKVTHYRNGDPIPNILTGNENYDWEKLGIPAYRRDWKSLLTGACCIYNNDTSNVNVYGLLYNWYTVKDPRGLAPKGWHVPTDEEWQFLADFLGGKKVAGQNLKSTSGWERDGNGDNNTGFTALPSGYRSYNSFVSMGFYAAFWASLKKGDLEEVTNKTWSWNLNYYYPEIYRGKDEKHYGFSIRCVKNM